MSKEFPFYIPAEYRPRPMDMTNMENLKLDPKEQVIKRLLTEIGKLKSELAEERDLSKFHIVGYTFRKYDGNINPSISQNLKNIEKKAKKDILNQVVPLYAKSTTIPKEPI